MKVLHLAPPSPASATAIITAHSFIDEEILALRDAGVRCYAVSDAPGQAEWRMRVRIVRTGRPRPSRVMGTLGFASARAGSLPVAALLNPRDLFHALRIERTAAALIAREQIDVIHSHFGWPGGFGGALAAAHTGVPLVASLRGMDLLRRDDIGYGLRQDPLYDRALRQLLRHASRTLYATAFMQEAGIACGAPQSRAVLVRKGVDLDRFRPPDDRPGIQRSLGLEGPVILAAGGLGPRKGYRTLLTALAALGHGPWTLVICGDGPERGALEHFARTAGIGARVRFAGAVPRASMAKYFAAADVFVHPAVLEAAGNVILEALASGCATIATDSGGPPEYLMDGETGLIVPAEDPSALAAAIRKLLEERVLRERMAAAARRDAEARFAYPRMVGDLLSVYRTVSADPR
jgi:glycosyltransferase involved in cell wall biosynthesis